MSSNSGSSWTETQPAGNTNGSWYLTAVSASGSNMMAGNQGGRLYLSTNSGSSWTETQPDGNSGRRWSTGAMSANGSILLAAEDSGLSTNGRLFISSNSGGSWTEAQPSGNADRRWVTSSMSSDGTKMIVGSWQGYGRLFVSSNSGSTWTEVQPAGDVNKNWFATSMSADGQTILAAAQSGRVYVSTDGGSSWSETQPAGNTNAQWQAVSVSSDGFVMLASVYGGRMYLSTNGGSSWSETQPAGNTTKAWLVVGMSGDSAVMIANVYGGRMYLGANPTLTPSPTPAPTSTPTPTPVPATRNADTTIHNPPSTTKYAPCTGSAPEGVPDLFQIDVATTSATVYYAPASDATSHIILYGQGENIRQYAVDTGQGTSSGVQSFTISSLQPNTTYSFALKAKQGCVGGSILSRTMTVHTGTATTYYPGSSLTSVSAPVSRIIHPAPARVSESSASMQRVVPTAVPTAAVKGVSTQQRLQKKVTAKPQKTCLFFICW